MVHGCISWLLVTQVDEDVALPGSSASINEPASRGNQRARVSRTAGGGRTVVGLGEALPVQRRQGAVHVVGGL